MLSFDKLLSLITVIAACGSVGATIWAAVLANKYWNKQKVVERNMQIEANNHQKYLEAHMAAWKLLAYLAKEENTKNIILYSVNPSGTEHFFVRSNGVAFIEELSKVFYDEGHGLFLSTDAKDKLYHTRNMVYGFLLQCKTRKKTDNEIKIENAGLVTGIFNNYEELRNSLKASVTSEKGNT